MHFYLIGANQEELHLASVACLKHISEALHPAKEEYLNRAQAAQMQCCLLCFRCAGQLWAIASSRCLGVCMCQVEIAQPPLESILTHLDDKFHEN